jgi:hypothetical protein
MALNGLNLGLQLHEDLFGPARQIQKSFEMQRSMQDALCPPAVRNMLEMQRSTQDALCPPATRGMVEMHKTMARLADPGGLGKVARTLGATFAEHAAAKSAMGSFVQAARLHKDLFGASTVADLTVGLRDILGPSLVTQQMAAFTRLDRALGMMLPTGIHDHWQRHLSASVVPSLSVLGQEWTRPVGVLASLEHPRSGASLSWLRPTSSMPAVAALLAEGPPRLPEITVDVTVRCAFCGELMIAHETSFRWKGNRRGALDLHVIPICPSCTRRSLEDPEYAGKALRELTAPKLRLVRPAGHSDGVRRGILRLVHDDDDDDRGDDPL